jgi:hypothetical protein
MPHKDPEAKRAYKRAWYAKRMKTDPGYATRYRRLVEKSCVICLTVFESRPETQTCSRGCANRLAAETRLPRPDNPKPWLADADSKQKGWLNAHGYRMVYRPDHPRADSRGCVQEHRAVMETLLDRLLAAGESVHHLNGQRADNRSENLELWTRPQPAGVRATQTGHCATCACAPSAE